MYGVNAQFASSNARDYMDLLFNRSGGNVAAKADGNDTAWRAPSYDRDSGTTAQDRALSNIISIIWNMQNGGGAQEAEVDSYNGYILGATGTDDADTFAIKGVSAFDLSSGNGDDTFNVKVGSLGMLDGGSGNDTINIAAHYAGDIAGGDGDDTIGFVGSIADSFSGGSGSDALKIAADTILGADGGEGDDTMQLEGQRIFASGGRGDDVISIKTSGDEAAELRFAAGDGQDTVTANGAIDIRFSISDHGSGLSALTPDDLDISASNGQLIIRALGSDDRITINFSQGALTASEPGYSFEMDKGDYVLRIR